MDRDAYRADQIGGAPSHSGTTSSSQPRLSRLRTLTADATSSAPVTLGPCARASSRSRRAAGRPGRRHGSHERSASRSLARRRRSPSGRSDRRPTHPELTASAASRGSWSPLAGPPPDLQLERHPHPVRVRREVVIGRHGLPMHSSSVRSRVLSYVVHMVYVLESSARLASRGDRVHSDLADRKVRTRLANHRPKGCSWLRPGI